MHLLPLDVFVRKLPEGQKGAFLHIQAEPVLFCGRVLSLIRREIVWSSDTNVNSPTQQTFSNITARLGAKSTFFVFMPPCQRQPWPEASCLGLTFYLSVPFL